MGGGHRGETDFAPVRVSGDGPQNTIKSHGLAARAPPAASPPPALAGSSECRSLPAATPRTRDHSCAGLKMRSRYWRPPSRGAGYIPAILPPEASGHEQMLVVALPGSVRGATAQIVQPVSKIEARWAHAAVDEGRGVSFGSIAAIQPRRSCKKWSLTQNRSATSPTPSSTASIGLCSTLREGSLTSRRDIRAASLRWSAVEPHRTSAGPHSATRLIRATADATGQGVQRLPATARPCFKSTKVPILQATSP